MRYEAEGRRGKNKINQDFFLLAFVFRSCHTWVLAINKVLIKQHERLRHIFDISSSSSTSERKLQGRNDMLFSRELFFPSPDSTISQSESIRKSNGIYLSFWLLTCRSATPANIIYAFRCSHGCLLGFQASSDMKTCSITINSSHDVGKLIPSIAWVSSLFSDMSSHHVTSQSITRRSSQVQHKSISVNIVPADEILSATVKMSSAFRVN